MTSGDTLNFDDAMAMYGSDITKTLRTIRIQQHGGTI